LKERKKGEKKQAMKCLGCPTLILQKKEEGRKRGRVESNLIALYTKNRRLLNVNIKTL
jgi:hypothetical protein